MISLIGKSIIFTDTHIGRKNFSVEKTNKTLSYMQKTIDDNNISNIFFLGDFFDNRKQISWDIFNIVVEFFENNKDKNIIFIVGNHDIFYKNRIDINSLKFLDKMFENITVLEKSTIVKFNDKNLLFIPWLVDEQDQNRPDEIMIQSSDLILGHFEFINFALLPGVMSSHGDTPDVYKGKKILSGHYHVSSTKNNVHYLGTCEQMNWSDYNEIKGCNILNEDLSLDFIENLDTDLYLKIYFDSSKKDDTKICVTGTKESLYFDNVNTMLQHDVFKHKNNIKIYVKDKSDKTSFTSFFITLDMNHIEYVVIDITPEMENLVNNNHEVGDSKESLNDILLKMLDGDDESKRIFTEIYTEALVISEM